MPVAVTTVCGRDKSWPDCPGWDCWRRTSVHSPPETCNRGMSYLCCCCCWNFVVCIKKQNQKFSCGTIFTKMYINVMCMVLNPHICQCWKKKLRFSNKRYRLFPLEMALVQVKASLQKCKIMTTKILST